MEIHAGGDNGMRAEMGPVQPVKTSHSELASAVNWFTISVDLWQEKDASYHSIFVKQDASPCSGKTLFCSLYKNRAILTPYPSQNGCQSHDLPIISRGFWSIYQVARPHWK